MSLEEQEPEVGSLIESERGNERNSAGRWWHPWITKEDWGSFSTKTKRAIELISIIFIFLSIFVIYVDVKFILVQRSWNNYDTPGFPLDIRSASDLYGLFWVTENSVLHKVRNGDENFNSSALEKLPLEAFDPRKPTVIYIHGWEKGSIARRFMETTHYKNNDDVYGDDIHAVNEWKSKGWNFGIWYWGRFSDEDDVMLAESKIWSFDGPSKMRWRKNDLSFDEETYASVFQGHSIGDLLFDEISASMKNRWVNTSFRIIGHSLGAQLTLNLCDKILNMESESRSILPSRIDLADPFLTIYSKPYFPFQEKETVQDFSIVIFVFQTLIQIRI